MDGGETGSKGRITHVVQGIPLVRDLHNLHAPVHALSDVQPSWNRDLRHAEDACICLVELGDEVDGEVRAGVVVGTDAEVDNGGGPAAVAVDGEGAAGERPGGAVVGRGIETAASGVLVLEGGVGFGFKGDIGRGWTNMGTAIVFPRCRRGRGNICGLW